MIEKKLITQATINDTFQEISDVFGYDATEYADEITDLLQLWNDQGFVEIYQTAKEREFGFIKDSSINNQGAVSPYYIGLFHARLLKGDNDPLVVVKFHENEDGEYVDMRFMIDHDELFGTVKVKRDTHQLRAMWLEIDAQVKRGD